MTAPESDRDTRPVPMVLRADQARAIVALISGHLAANPPHPYDRRLVHGMRIMRDMLRLAFRIPDETETLASPTVVTIGWEDETGIQHRFSRSISTDRLAEVIECVNRVECEGES